MEELLSLARADSGRENLRLDPLDLRALIAQAGNEWRQLVEARNLQCKLTLVNREVAVLADRIAIQRLLAILIDNAVKYTPPPGVIGLCLEEDRTARFSAFVIPASGVLRSRG